MPRLVNVWARYQRTLEFIIPTSDTPYMVYFPLDSMGQVFVMPSFEFDDTPILREITICSVDGNESIAVHVPHKLVGWYTSPQPALQSTMPENMARFDLVNSRLRDGRVDGFGLHFDEDGVTRLYPWFEIDAVELQRVTLVNNGLLTSQEKTFDIPLGTAFLNITAPAPNGTIFYRWDRQQSPNGTVSPWSGVIDTTISRVVARFAFEIEFVPNGGYINGSPDNFSVIVLVAHPLSNPLAREVSLQSIVQNFAIMHPPGQLHGWYSVALGRVLDNLDMTRAVNSNHVLYAAFLA